MEVVSYPPLRFFLLISPLCVQYDLPNWPRFIANHQLSGELDFQASSWPLFSMYLTIVEEVDKKTTERWKKGTDEILAFVSPCVAVHTKSITN